MRCWCCRRQRQLGGKLGCDGVKDSIADDAFFEERFEFLESRQHCGLPVEPELEPREAHILDVPQRAVVLDDALSVGHGCGC